MSNYILNFLFDSCKSESPKIITVWVHLFSGHPKRTKTWTAGYAVLTYFSLFSACIAYDGCKACEDVF